MKYDEDVRFSMYYFEDSYVLGIHETETEITFEMDIVLTSHHPLYEQPEPTSQYCYRRGRLYFREISRKELIELDMQPSIDADGSMDYGEIDEFSEDSPQHFRLCGSWGRIVVVAGDAGVELCD